MKHEMDHPCSGCFFFGYEKVEFLVEKESIYKRVNIPICNKYGFTLTIDKCDKFEVE